MHDLRYALRQLARAPGVTLVAVLAIALGIGANTAIFSLVHGILLRPLPFPEAERLAFIGEWSEQVPNMSVSYPNFVDFRDRQSSFSEFGAGRSQGFNLIGPERAERVNGAMASAGLFRTFGVQPLHGRLYSDHEDTLGASRTVLLREGFWRRHFGGDRSIVGTEINLSGELYTVVGIMPESVAFPSAGTELWIPLGLWADRFSDRGDHPGIYCIGRLRDDASFEEARTDLAGIAANLAREYPATNARQSISLRSLSEQAFGQVRPALLVLLAAAGCVLLIACANVANLLLARAMVRSREFAVRAALGAGRGRVIRQLLVESLVLGLLGCAAGVLVGWWSLEGLRGLLPPNVPRLAEVDLNGGVLLFALLASLGTSILFGLVPAWHAAKQDLRDALAQGGRSNAPAGGRVRGALIIGEFALTSVLLVGAGLMLRTLSNLNAADPGFSTSQLVTFNWVMNGADYQDPEQRRPLIDRALARLERLPGVEHVGLINPLPLTGEGNQNSYHVEGTPAPEPGRQPSTEFFQVNEQTFAALQMPLIAGRSFDEHDRSGSPLVAIVDTRFVEKNFGPGVNPIGRRFRYGAQPSPDGKGYREIIGVVPHIENYGLGRNTREQTYVPAAQSVPNQMVFMLRTSQDPASLASAARQAMSEVAPSLPVFGFQTMEELFNQTIGTQRLTMVLLGAFAVLALVLAAVGLYGVLSTSVSQRTRELGIRVALGATTAAVVGLVVRQGFRLALVGLAIGLALAFAAAQLLESVLYGVSATDRITFISVMLLLVAIGVVACWIPARRAARVNPIEALRAD